MTGAHSRPGGAGGAARRATAAPSAWPTRAPCTTRETPLHLAFSCYVWTPTAGCSSPGGRWPRRPSPACGPTRAAATRRPGRTIEEAVVRRVRQELGLSLRDLRLVLPRFRYRAVMDNGVIENEMCPVFVATTDGRRACRPRRGRGRTAGSRGRSSGSRCWPVATSRRGAASRWPSCPRDLVAARPVLARAASGGALTTRFVCERERGNLSRSADESLLSTRRTGAGGRRRTGRVRRPPRRCPGARGWPASTLARRVAGRRPRGPRRPDGRRPGRRTRPVAG